MQTRVLWLDQATKIYDQRSVFGVSDISFEIKSGEIVCLAGPSGSGKSTTLKLITKELLPDRGHVEVTSHLSYVAQFTSLNEHITVMENILSGISQEMEQEKKINLARNAAQSLELTNELEKLPSQISGGQRQRVIMARALVSEPELIIMDEPFAHLDTILRLQLMDQLWQIFRDKKIAILWVTHETTEALAYSDKVVALNLGKIQQQGTPQQIYQRPSNMFVATFFSASNCLAGKVVEQNPVTIELLGQKYLYSDPEFKPQSHGDALVIVHPGQIQVGEAGTLSGKVNRSLYFGDHWLLDIEVQNQLIQAKVPASTNYQVGQSLRLEIPASALYCLNEI